MSDWKEESIKRRDTRNSKESDEPRRAVKIAQKKKNTKRWCRGKEGIEHKPECRPYAEVKNCDRRLFQSWRILVCSVCGKELECYTGRREPRPDWVKI